MALSFLYIGFTRVLELLRLRGSDTTDLAIEVVILRHEVAVKGTKSSAAGLLARSERQVKDGTCNTRQGHLRGRTVSDR
jgi:hypothetical protein